MYILCDFIDNDSVEDFSKRAYIRVWYHIIISVDGGTRSLSKIISTTTRLFVGGRLAPC